MKKNIISAFFILIIAQTTLFSQNVDAGDDIILCEQGESVRLSATYDSENYFYCVWSPGTGLSDTLRFNPLCTPTATTTYHFSAYYLQNTNLVVNGDFSQGSMGFLSGYIYGGQGSSALYPEGTYSVVSQASSVHSDFPGTYDHTVGTSAGRYLAVNGAGTAGTVVWEQTINVVPHTDYVFNAWVLTLVANSQSQTAILQFSINGSLLGTPFNAPYPATNPWEEFYVTWNSGANTTAVIRIVNQNTTLSGNDFGLDDISFIPILPITDSVTVYIIDPMVEEISVTVCDEGSYFFAGEELTTPGVYTDTLTNVWGCDSIVILTLNFAPPLTVELGSDIRVCKEDSPEVKISSPPGYQTYEWSTGETTPAITVDENGIYHLTVTNEDGCVATDSISITFINTPKVAIVNHTEEFCDKYMAELEAVTDASYVLWNNGELTNNIMVENPGTYSVVAQREMCKSKAVYTIEECDFHLYFPNSFTPGDANGVNDYFSLSDPELVLAVKVAIYNRYGELLFYTEDPYFKWDGTHRGKLCSTGVYSYTVHVVANTKKSYYFRGSILLM